MWYRSAQKSFNVFQPDLITALLHIHENSRTAARALDTDPYLDDPFAEYDSAASVESPGFEGASSHNADDDPFVELPRNTGSGDEIFSPDYDYTKLYNDAFLHPMLKRIRQHAGDSVKDRSVMALPDFVGRQLGERLHDDPEFQRLLRRADEGDPKLPSDLRYRHNGEITPGDLAMNAIRMWNESGTAFPNNASTLMIANDVFGLGGRAQLDHLPKLLWGGGEYQLAQEYYKALRNGYAPFLEAQYHDTQNVLKNAGIDNLTTCETREHMPDGTSLSL